MGVAYAIYHLQKMASISTHYYRTIHKKLGLIFYSQNKQSNIINFYEYIIITYMYTDVAFNYSGSFGFVHGMFCVLPRKEGQRYYGFFSQLDPASRPKF